MVLQPVPSTDRYGYSYLCRARIAQEEDRLKLLSLAAALLLIQAGSAVAHGFRVGDIEVTHPFLRATQPDVASGAGYMILINHGSMSERLVRIESDAAASVQLQRSTTVNGVSLLTPILDGIEIPAGGEYQLGGEGARIALEGLSGGLILGDIGNATLLFEHAGLLPIQFEVEPMATTIAGAMERHIH